MFSFPILFGHSDWSKTHVLFNKKRSLGRVLHCDKTRPAFENTEEMQKTRVAAECFLHFSSVLKLQFSQFTILYFGKTWVFDK